MRKCECNDNDVTVWNCGCDECHDILKSNGDQGDCECDTCEQIREDLA